MQTGVVVLALLVLLFGVVSRPVERSVITAPMVFTAAGLLLGASGLGLIEVDLDGEVVSILAEATLGLVLFSDAARINLRRLRADAALPARMLGSLPLVILLGALDDEAARADAVTLDMGVREREREPERGERVVDDLRTDAEIEEGRDEHVAGHAAERVEVEEIRHGPWRMRSAAAAAP